jgi:TetR/AcrR family tetracycline transcriptional repressor
MVPAKRRTTPLTRDELIGTALTIVDSEGLEALSMRRLADEVGVQAASLYHHVPNKDALIDGMLVRIRSEVALAEPMPEEWVDLYVHIFAEYRRVLSAHPNLLVYAGRRVESDPDPDGLGYLMQLGLDEDEAVGLWQSMIAFVTGFALFSSRAAETGVENQAPDLAQRLTEWRDETADTTLRVIVEGYARSAGIR